MQLRPLPVLPRLPPQLSCARALPLRKGSPAHWAEAKGFPKVLQETGTVASSKLCVGAVKLGVFCLLQSHCVLGVQACEPPPLQP